MTTRPILLGLTLAVGIIGAVCFSAISQSAPTGKRTIRTGLTTQSFHKTIDKTVKGQYLLFLPEFYGRDQERLPLIVFLHGSGECGRPEAVKRFGPPRVAMMQKGFPFIVLAPICPPGKWWTDVDVVETVMAMLDEVSREYLVDTSRVYLTGMSMGGFGVWNLAEQYPQRFAAIAPLCGGGNPYLARRLKDIPTRIFHGAKDPNVNPGRSQEMAMALKAAGGNVELIIYPNLGHNVWTVTYDNPELYQWFLRHRKGVPPARTGETL